MYRVEFLFRETAPVGWGTSKSFHYFNPQGATRESCREFIAEMCRPWVGRRDYVPENFRIVDNYTNEVVS